MSRLPLALISVLAASCFMDEAPRDTSDSRIGVTLADNGEDFEIFVALCPGETVAAVDGYAFLGPFLPDDDDELIWRVEAEPPVAGATFTTVIGETPEDFEEVLPLPPAAIEQMTGEVRPAVVVTLASSPVVATDLVFDPAAVPADGYLNASRDVVPVEALQTVLDDLCPAEPSS